MARLPRATFSLMLAVLPATAAVIGLIVLGQVPTVRDLTGIGLVILGVALHRDRPQREGRSTARASAAGGAARFRRASSRRPHGCAQGPLQESPGV
jgi:inner membrane transporter RhtA